MALHHSGKIVKCDQKVDITATFGSDLVLEGFTAIPNILLKVYSQVGISDFQMLLLIQLIRFHVEEREYYPSPQMLAEVMESEPARLERELQDLLDKEIIAVSQFYDCDHRVIFQGYDFEPLFPKISDIWAAIRAREIEESKKLLNSQELAPDMFDNKVTGLINCFEKEFGRPLSPIEVEQIEQWAAGADASLVVEALRRAVLGGKHNFKYINSILVEWKKNNIRTLDAVEQYDRDFHKRRAGLKKRCAGPGEVPAPEDSKTDSKKKAFIRTLYI